MEKRVIYAIAISLAIWIVWGFISKPEYKPEDTAPVAVSETVKTAEEKKETVAKPTEKITKAVKNAVVEEKKSNLSTKNYKAVLSNKGAKIESLKYGKNSVELVAGSELLPVKGVLDFPVYFSDKELLNGSALDDQVWEIRKSEGNEFTFATVADINGKEVQIEKKYIFTENYYFDITYRIINTNKTAVDLPNGSIMISSPDFIGPKLSDYSGYYNAPSSVHVISGKDSLEKGDKGSGFFSKASDTKEAAKPAWAGIMSRFMTLAMIPQGFTADKAIWDSRADTGYRTALVSNIAKIEAGDSVEKKIRVCITEKDKDILTAVDPMLKPGTDINKFIEPIRAAVVFCLLWLYKLVGNFGVAIIIFSIATKLIFLPLTIKSTNSMKKMAELGPKMNELKAKFKDKPEQLQKATMELYKNAGVNPLGGCLPLVIQMPFFFALYSALSNSLDMWQSPFMFWIKDLSMPDTVGHIMGISINILPVLMTITTYFQQKLTAVDTGNPSQKIMMTLMPLMFIWIFWSMPSGLVLYWVIQNSLQIAHQLYIMRKPSTPAKAKA